MANNEPDISSTPESTSGLTTLSSSLPTLLPSPPASHPAPKITSSLPTTTTTTTIQPSPPSSSPAPPEPKPEPEAQPSKPPPAWARPTHYLETPRLILRTAKPGDAEAFTVVWRDERNSPFGGVVGNGLSLDEQREKLRSQAASTARGENGWMVVLLKPHLQDILDSSGLDSSSLDALKVSDGYLIGMTGYNTFSLVPQIPSQPKPDPEAEPRGAKQILETDTGTLTHHPFTHHGLGMETLQAVICYAFASLAVDSVTLETARVNTPFTGLMRGMGLGGFEGPGLNSDVKAQAQVQAQSEMVEKGRGGGEEEDGEKGEDGGKGEVGEVEEKKPKPDHGLGDQESVIFRFCQSEWEGAKAGMKERGRWYLD